MNEDEKFQFLGKLTKKGRISGDFSFDRILTSFLYGI